MLVSGSCRLCLREGDLTFEHTPPRSTFNSERVRILSLELVPGEGLVTSPAGWQQKGSGGYTLCADCNNYLGREVVPAYGLWIHAIALAVSEWQGGIKQVERSTEYLSGDIRLTVPDGGPRLQPARIARQIVAMLLTTSDPRVGEQHPELRDFVLNGTPLVARDGLTLSMCFYTSRLVRAGGPHVLVHLSERDPRILCELAHPPVAFLLNLNGQPPLDGIANTTDWLGLDDSRTAREMTITAQVGTGEPPYPADYRTEGQMDEYGAAEG